MINQTSMLMQRRRNFASLHGGKSALKHRGDPQGVTSLVANGTAAPTFSRSGTRLVKRYVSGAWGFYEVADGVVPVGINANGDYVISCEESGNNYIWHSTDISNWNNSDCTTPSTITSPLYGIPAYAMVESSDAGDTAHLITSTASSTNPGSTTPQMIRCIVAEGDRRYIRWRIRPGGGNTTYLSTIDLRTGAFSEFGSSDSTIQDYGAEALGTFGGKNWWLFWVRYIENLNYRGDIGRVMLMYSSVNGLTASYTGDGSTCFYCAYADHQYGSNLTPFSSPIVTTTETGTRAADSFYFKGDDGNLGGVGSDKKGTLRLEIYPEDHPLNDDVMLFSLNDGGSTADEIKIYVDTDGYVNASFDAGGGTSRTVTGPEVDVLDGDSSGHTVQLSYEAGRAKIWVDGTAGTENTDIVAADIPDDIDRMQYGYFPIGDERFYNPPSWSAL